MSVVALGALLARLPVVRPEAAEAALSALAGRAGAELVAANLRAMRRGLQEALGAASVVGAAPSDRRGDGV